MILRIQLSSKKVASPSSLEKMEHAFLYEGQSYLIMKTFFGTYTWKLAKYCIQLL